MIDFNPAIRGWIDLQVDLVLASYTVGHDGTVPGGPSQ